MKRMPRPTIIDLETFAAEVRPDYPPEPVGVAIKAWGRKARYYAWGHASGNNSTREAAVAAVRKAYACPDGVVFHNAKFDVDVIETHLGIPAPPWQCIHDTLFLLFLHDPHQFELGLKPAAHRLLGMVPEERDAVADWLTTNQPIPGVRISTALNSPLYWAGFIAYAPGDVVGPYARGDVERTEALFAHLWPKTVLRDMLTAYDRERQLMPVLLNMERRGVRVDLPRLQLDTQRYLGTFIALEDWIRVRLGASENLNLDSGDQLVAAMLAAGVADRELLGVTKKKGKVATSKEALARGVSDKTLAAALKYRAQLKTCLFTFMVPWLEVATRADGMIFTTWHQTRGAEKHGTRTGRLSSSPNFQNMPKEFDSSIFDGIEEAFLLALPPLPLCRSYIAPYAGQVLCGRDYQGQELRVLAHYEDGFRALYDADPWVDVHAHAQIEVNTRLGRNYGRKPIKTLGFGIIYGSGAASISGRLKIGYEDAKELKAGYLKVFPGLAQLYEEMRDRARNDEPIRTWGGREYYCQAPTIIDMRLVRWDYKMVNLLVQGSSADATKEAMIRFYYHPQRRPDWHLVLQVHDEVVLSVPEADMPAAHALLRDCMASLEFDVPMLSEGEWSRDNWGAMEKYDSKGEIVYRNASTTRSRTLAPV